MTAYIEAGPIVELDDGGLPRRLRRHRHFCRHGRSSGQKRRGPYHTSELRDDREADESEALNTTSHGDRPLRSTVPVYHHSGRPPHARAPHAGRMTSFRQVSWLAGLNKRKASGYLKKGSPPTVAGAAPDLNRAERAIAPDPFWPIKHSAHLNVCMEEAGVFLVNVR